MRLIILFFVLFIPYFLVSQSTDFQKMESCPIKIKNVYSVTREHEDLNHPKFSPDGKKLLVTTKGYTGVYMINLEDSNKITTITTEPKSGYSARWTANGDEVEYKTTQRDNFGKVKVDKFNYNLQQKSSKIIFNENTKPNNAAKLIKSELSINYNSRGDKVLASDGMSTWEITKEPGTYFDFILSPDKSKVIIHANGIYIYNTDGSGLYSYLGKGICQSWSPDGKYLLYFIDDDYGKDYIVESDIYLSTIKGDKKWRLTDTKDKIELWPYWSPSGDKITYFEANSGKVFISEILINN